MKFVSLALICFAFLHSIKASPLFSKEIAHEQISKLLKTANSLFDKGDLSRAQTFCEAAIYLDRYSIPARRLLDKIRPDLSPKQSILTTVIHSDCDFRPICLKAEQDAAANP